MAKYTPKLVRYLVIIIIAVFTSWPLSLASADIKQTALNKITKGTEKIGEEVHSTLSFAQKLGFMVKEVRIEVSITPKVEVYFRDVGDTGQLKNLLPQANKKQKFILQMLQSTRKFNMPHYSPAGVKLITGIEKPAVEILLSFNE